MHLCLETPYLLYIVDSVTLNLNGQQHYTSLEQSCKNMCFLRKTHHSLCALGTLSSTSAICLGAILHSKNQSPNKAQKCEECGTKQALWKGHLFIVWELKREGSIALFDLSGECVSWVTQFFCPFAHIQEWPWKHSKYWFWSYTFQVVGKFANMNLHQ